VLSALGLALADFTVDFSQTVMLDPLGRGSEMAEKCAAAFAPLEAAGRAVLGAHGFVGEDSAVLERALDVRYRGQSFELTVPVEDLDLEGALAAFHAAHETRYGYARPGEPVEIVNVRLTSRGIRPKPTFSPASPASSSDPSAAVIGRTPMHLRGRWTETEMYDRDLLEPGHEMVGPALIVQEDATTVLIPGWLAVVDPWLNLVVDVG
jgi:N-methylhydantoinase A